ncbi:hypothetical protein K437DRAFT_106334 [Tilletiaria anomala UBC 951]|uniref:Uncharacterized protein n=1 Tax=Tilletiaria anomala (strain ATCC 24038 / CBS 436.72 / UBC 951) TaxID=1037660 RepID=A0A066VY18_TILAU|nr:uncharacterized protein K437DRAFT_106334 [Tilletiaria anomala UBC 951]KDN46637.1 hypothetical protein K437DRAFT_106334 [Tilletiaria anomala UBC 951]
MEKRKGTERNVLAMPAEVQLYLEDRDNLSSPPSSNRLQKQHTAASIRAVKQQAAQKPVVDMPSPPPAPPAPPAPAPTRAATSAAVLHDDSDGSRIEHLVLQQDELEVAIRRRNTASSSKDTIAGPFFARSENDVLALKRTLLESERERRRSKGRSSSSNSNGISSNKKRDKGFLQKRGQHAIEEVLKAQQREQLLGPYFRDSGHEGMMLERQTAQENECFVGNDVLSCYPTSDTTVVQGSWSKFIWNNNYPRFRQIGAVDVYLYRQDTDKMQTSWLSLDNNLGRLSFSPNDPWWADRPRAQELSMGQNMSWPFYFVITAAGLGLDSDTISRLSTFSAIQTAPPASVVAAQAASSSLSAAASLSSASAALSDSRAVASASASIVSQLSLSIESSLRSEGLSGTQTAAAVLTTTLPNGAVVTASATAAANGLSLSGNSRGSSDNLALPSYAIALIVVFGFIALVGALVGAYFLSKAARKRRERVHSGSYGSSSPMMHAVDGSLTRGSDDAALAATAAGDAAVAGAGVAGLGAAGGAAGWSRSSRSSHDSHPFSSDEATRMADAFRNALRKPEFTGAVFGSGQNSPNETDFDADGGIGAGASDAGTGLGADASGAEEAVATGLLRDELASEGKDLKAVERGRPKVHTDAGL